MRKAAAVEAWKDTERGQEHGQQRGTAGQADRGRGESERQ